LICSHFDAYDLVNNENTINHGTWNKNNSLPRSKQKKPTEKLYEQNLPFQLTLVVIKENKHLTGIRNTMISQ